MNKEFIAPVLALVGVIISVLISFFVARKQVNVLTKEIHSTIRLTYATLLIEERIKRYPEIYFKLSEFLKESQSDYSWQIEPLFLRN